MELCTLPFLSENVCGTKLSCWCGMRDARFRSLLSRVTRIGRRSVENSSNKRNRLACCAQNSLQYLVRKKIIEKDKQTKMYAGVKRHQGSELVLKGSAKGEDYAVVHTTVLSESPIDRNDCGAL